MARGPGPADPRSATWVAIGVSTGGPPAVQKVLSALPGDFPAGILIAQHMPGGLHRAFRQASGRGCATSPSRRPRTASASRPARPTWPPAARHLAISSRVSRIEVVVTDEPKAALYKPSANVLITSVANALGRRALGVVLTGMGNDGKEGVDALKAKGGRALAQSDATCVVYGMPKAIVDAGLADEIVDIDDMASAIEQSLYL